jgi:hypothetical protein
MELRVTEKRKEGGHTRIGIRCRCFQLSARQNGVKRGESQPSHENTFHSCGEIRLGIVENMPGLADS